MSPTVSPTPNPVDDAVKRVTDTLPATPTPAPTATPTPGTPVPATPSGPVASILDALLKPLLP
jgi:hypothetical protein